MPAQLISPGEALSGQFDSPAVETNYRAKKAVSTERRHGFWLGNIGLLLPFEIISEVSEGLAICRLPNTPAWMVGMSNLRGNMVPVFDLGLLLGIQTEKNSDRKQLFIKIEKEWVGVISDRMPSRIILNKENKLDELPPVPDELRTFVHTCYQQTDIWLDWDIQGFFSWVAERVNQQ